MKQRLSLLLFASLFFSSFTQDTYQYVPVINWQYKPVIKVTLNGKSANFLLDTGSDITLLNSHAARWFQFRPLSVSTGRRQAVGFSGRRQATYRVKNVSLFINSTPIKALYRAFDLSSLVNFTNDRIDVRITGIIGSDVMKRYGFIINYQNQTVTMISHQQEELQ